MLLDPGLPATVALPPGIQADGQLARMERALRRREDRKVEAELRRSLAETSFVLHYQPRLHLDSGEIRGAEALIRWPHRKRGLIPPGAFIPIAERSGLISDIGGWVLAEACRACMEWPGRLTVSVNVSARQLQDGVLLRQVSDALDRSGLPPEQLELELTESMLVEECLETLLALSAIRDLGVGLALDDFGTGYASLSMLKRLPLTVMKLDRSLVRGVPQDPEDSAIVRAIVETGTALRLGITAEGIETEAQRAYLVGIGCGEGQGYLFSHPLPGAAFAARLACWPVRTA